MEFTHFSLMQISRDDGKHDCFACNANEQNVKGRRPTSFDVFDSAVVYRRNVMADNERDGANTENHKTAVAEQNAECERDVKR